MYPYEPNKYLNRFLATGRLTSLAIMRVNKRLNQEATIVLYAGAAFRLSSGYWFLKFFDDNTTIDCESFSAVHNPCWVRSYFRNHHITLEMQWRFLSRMEFDLPISRPII